MKKLTLLGLPLFLPFLLGCPSANTPTAPPPSAPVTVIELVTATFTPTGSFTSTFTITLSPTSTWTPVTILSTPTDTPTGSATPTLTFTWSPTSTLSPTSTWTPVTILVTPTFTHTPTLTHTPSFTPTPVITNTPTITHTPTIVPGTAWTQMNPGGAPGPTLFAGRTYAGGVSFAGKMWVIGGNDGIAYRNDTWSSTDGVTWSQVNPGGAAGPNLFSQRANPGVLAYAGKLWVVGGNDGGFKNDVWSSVDGTSWTPVQPGGPASSTLFSPRFDNVALVHNGAMWVIGGNDGGPYKNDTWSSTDGITWTEVNPGGAPSPTLFSGRFRYSALSHNGRIWVIGGNDGGFKNDTWSSTDGISWTQDNPGGAPGPALFDPRIYFGALSYGGSLWVIGGFSGANHNDTWSSTNAASWTPVQAGGPAGPTRFSGRQGPLCLDFNGRMWVIGGFNGASFLNDSWRSP